ncbi:hypothetical protein WISP_150241 [Willisornis vidua]|uniref:Uncharacterized protein n=1 Tax=Willisornis vidua TaxID=1566151 RepID=A0ABQ9CMF1_9PASS|nr:hypothetical protein WISP_150241 [Willisornis vidua]
MAGVSYSPPWWVSLLHRLPHLSLRWELTAADFRPHDAEYQQNISLQPEVKCSALDLPVVMSLVAVPRAPADGELEGRLKGLQGRTCYFYLIAALLVVLLTVNAMVDPENMISI